jgi:spore maturation protein CgeB
VVAIACKACRMRYLAWIYDSPCVEVYSETVAYDTNYVFIFDRQTCFDLLKKGVNTVYYLPLAADVEHYDKVIKEHPPAYKADVSFIGSLYNKVKPQFAPIMEDVGYLRGYLDGLVKAQQGVYGVSFLEKALTPEIILYLQKLCQMPQRVHSMESLEWLYANYFLAKLVTGRERLEIVRSLAQSHENFTLYSEDSTADFPEINNKGYIDYYSQSPLAFHHSKINLNITVRSIYSGIPLRAFDIMGCGGFLLSNFQADYLEHFAPGEDFVYYESIDDLRDKVAYYLQNEEERQRIARNGYEKVKQEHTYHHRIREMLAVINEG